jgi:hypothetical protein
MQVTSPNRTIALCYGFSIGGAIAAVLTLDAFLDLARDESLLAPVVMGAFFAAFAVTMVLGFGRK